MSKNQATTNTNEPTLNPNPAPVPENKVEKEEMVTISKAVWESIVNKVDELSSNQKQYEQTAPQDQIRKIEALRASGKLVNNVKISIYNGKYVKSWVSIVDEVYIDHVLGKEVSKQMTKIFFFDGSNLELSQSEFSRRKTYKEFEVIKEGKDRDGNIILTVMDSDGQELEIDIKYIN